MQKKKVPKVLFMACGIATDINATGLCSFLQEYVQFYAQLASLDQDLALHRAWDCCLLGHSV